jgi:hypothetical protein
MWHPQCTQLSEYILYTGNHSGQYSAPLPFGCGVSAVSPLELDDACEDSFTLPFLIFRSSEIRFGYQFLGLQFQLYHPAVTSSAAEFEDRLEC